MLRVCGGCVEGVLRGCIGRVYGEGDGGTSVNYWKSEGGLGHEG